MNLAISAEEDAEANSSCRLVTSGEEIQKTLPKLFDNKPSGIVRQTFRSCPALVHGYISTGTANSVGIAPYEGLDTSHAATKICSS